MFRIFLFFGCVFAVFPVFYSIPGVDPHVPHILWIEDDWLCQGWVWVQPKLVEIVMMLLGLLLKLLQVEDESLVCTRQGLGDRRAAARLLRHA